MLRLLDFQAKRALKVESVLAKKSTQEIIKIHMEHNLPHQLKEVVPKATNLLMYHL